MHAKNKKERLLQCIITVCWLINYLILHLPMWFWMGGMGMGMI